MFTGIVEELGQVLAVQPGADSAVLRIRGPLVVGDARHGASIAVNGVCLTVVDHDGESFTADVMAETLQRSSLGDLVPGSPVNLERAMPADGRFGGHIVQGHVDATTTIVRRRPGDRWETVTFALPPQLARYLVEKGSVTVDGVSLTVAEVQDPPPGAPSAAGTDGSTGTFSVGLIPTTLALTTLGRKQVGDQVNLEVDVLAKYLERMLIPLGEDR